MAHLLIVDDQNHIRREWAFLLNQENHTYKEAANVDETLEIIKTSEKEGEPFDLILLDHQLGDEKGINVLTNLNHEYYQYRIVVITGFGTNDVAREYAKMGSIGHLIKPVSEMQFHTAIAAALERRYIYVDEKENWENAYELLNNIGLLESVEKLQIDSARMIDQYQTLRVTYDKLLADLEKAGGREKEMAQAYLKATNSLNSGYAGIESIIPFLTGFMITQSFWSDVKDIFDSNRLQFFILQSYLRRIQEQSSVYQIKHLVGGATGHYEYRIGRNYRLYFRRQEGVIVFERFGHKNIQDTIISFLDENIKKAVEPILESYR
jgi:FixJ family two-component response regulator